MSIVVIRCQIFLFQTLGDEVQGRTQLDWDSRLKFALGAAKGIAFIHSEGGPNFTHGNIKSERKLLLEIRMIQEIEQPKLKNKSSSE